VRIGERRLLERGLSRGSRRRAIASAADARTSGSTSRWCSTSSMSVASGLGSATSPSAARMRTAGSGFAASV
jgi:hypothetical protein